MNELLLALKTSYNTFTGPSTSSTSSFSDVRSQQSPDPPEEVERDGVSSREDTIPDGDCCPPPSYERTHRGYEPVTTPDHIHPSQEMLFTPRTRKKWSDCSKTLFINCRSQSVEVEDDGLERVYDEDEGKETSIEGIYIQFQNNIPYVIDKKRQCQHISALAHVSCFHHSPPTFAKRKERLTSSESECKYPSTLNLQSTDENNRSFESKECQTNLCEIEEDSSCSDISISLDKENVSSDKENIASDKENVASDKENIDVNVQVKKLCIEAEGIDVDSGGNKDCNLNNEIESLEDRAICVEKQFEEIESHEISDIDHIKVITIKENTEFGESTHDGCASPTEPRKRMESVDEHFLEEGRYYVVKEDSENGSLRMQPSVPEDFYKAVQQKTPNEHVFVEYGKETRRIVLPCLPISLHALRDEIVKGFSDNLRHDMIPIKSLYIEDPQTKIFYQLDDACDIIKGSHLKINEEFIAAAVDRGSSQSLDDLHNSSNSSLSSSGFVIPATVPIPPLPESKINMRRPGKSRLSLVEEKLNLITSELVQKDTGSHLSEVSSQTDFEYSSVPIKQLHSTILTLNKNLMDAKIELAALRRRELDHRREIEQLMVSTARLINKEIAERMPFGLRKKRIDVDKVEADYRKISERSYTNIKDLEMTVEFLKTDVIKRKVRLDPQQLEAMENELKNYSSQIETMNSTFGGLKETLKDVMAEELEIIVNEEQFLADEQPMLEEVTTKCQELIKIMETLKKVATMQKQQGTKQVELYTLSEYDILEERSAVLQAIGSIVPNHEERIQSIQATQEFRAAQKKFIKSETEQLTDEINLKSQNLRKTNKFEELERRREAALRDMYTAHPPTHKFGRKKSLSDCSLNENGVSDLMLQRRSSINKCKSMSSIAYAAENEAPYRQSDVELSDDEAKSDDESSGLKRSHSFSGKDKEKNNSEDEKGKKKSTMFSGFFSKKGKTKQESIETKNAPSTPVEKDVAAEEPVNNEVLVVDTNRHKKKSSHDTKQIRIEEPSELNVNFPIRSNTIDTSTIDHGTKKKHSKTKKSISQDGLTVGEEKERKRKSRKSKNR